MTETLLNYRDSGTLGHASPLRVQVRVIGALILRDMRTRFGRKITGWIIMVMWPLSHLLFLMIGYLIAHRIAPVGTNVTVFIGTGVLPYILCLYPARMIMLCLVQNQPLLLFPPVTAVDVIIARSILEIVNAFWVVALFCLTLFVLDIDFLPMRYGDAILAILATIYLGFAIGFISAILLKLVRAWLPIQIVLLILAYIVSGAIVPITSVPEQIRQWLWFNPLVHSVEWLRGAYYDAYGEGVLSRGYLIGYATMLIFIGLVMERAIRGRLLES
ncbi:MAG: ABC transporter permease [Rhizobiales bacterium]|nr:ABC transporter permease [Hyphomicrobiales bacterium]